MIGRHDNGYDLLYKPIGKFAFWHNDMPIFVQCIGDIARCQDRRDGNPDAIIGDVLTATNSSSQNVSEDLNYVGKNSNLRPKPNATLLKWGSPFPAGFGRKRSGKNDFGSEYTASSRDIPLGKFNMTPDPELSKEAYLILANTREPLGMNIPR